MIEYIAMAGETIEKIAKAFFGDIVHAESLGRINNINSKETLAAGTKIKVPPKIHSVAKRSGDGKKVVINVNVTKRICYEGSVGAEGENKPESVLRVKTRLQELGYPIDCVNENCGADTIQAIRLFQVFNCVLKRNYYRFDGRVDKNGATEKLMFSADAKEYHDLAKGSVKPWQASPKSSKDSALQGDDQNVKNIWKKIDDVWNAVSPYLPDGAELSSGYRSIEKQRELLFKKYLYFQKDIELKYGKEVVINNIEKKNQNLNEEEKTNLDKEMHSQIKGIGKGNEVALPGRSPHIEGRAIDIGGSAQRIESIRALGYYMYKINNTNVCAINNETNCIHFEFN